MHVRLYTNKLCGWICRVGHGMGVVSPSCGMSSTITGATGAAEDTCSVAASQHGADCKRSTRSPDDDEPEEAPPLPATLVGMEAPFIAAISSKSVLARRDAFFTRRAWRRFSCNET